MLTTDLFRRPDDALEAYCLAVKYEHETLQKAVEVRAAASNRFRKDPVAWTGMMGGKGVVELVSAKSTLWTIAEPLRSANGTS